MDNWKHRNQKMKCKTCMYYVPKVSTTGKTFIIGRCRRNAPTMKGYPVVFETDWCGEHKIDEEKIDVYDVPTSNPPNILKKDDYTSSTTSESEENNGRR